MKIVILGLSITSSWGNGHATTFRSLVKGLHKRGHDVLFLERDVPWYASARDMPESEHCKTGLYSSLAELKKNYISQVEDADLVIVGSYVPDGIEVGKWVINTASGVKAFYDIDAPVTIASLRNKSCQYISPKIIPYYDLYLSFSAGQCLSIFEYEFGSPAARAFYCSVDTELYRPMKTKKQWDLGYLGTYSDDRQPVLKRLMIDPASKMKKKKFVVAGPRYPESVSWPSNLTRIEHLPPALHPEFYNSQRYTLNITRSDMVKMGYSPSVRMFEAAACGVPIISDYWPGIYTIFSPGAEILISSSADDTVKFISRISERQRKSIGENARQAVLSKHTGEHRAAELEKYVAEIKVNAGKRQYSVFT